MRAAEEIELPVRTEGEIAALERERQRSWRGARRAQIKQIVGGAARQAFGKPLIQHQGLVWSLADVATDLEALRALTSMSIRPPPR